MPYVRVTAIWPLDSHRVLRARGGHLELTDAAGALRWRSEVAAPAGLVAVAHRGRRFFWSDDGADPLVRAQDFDGAPLGEVRSSPTVVALGCDAEGTRVVWAEHAAIYDYGALSAWAPVDRVPPAERQLDTELPRVTAIAFLPDGRFAVCDTRGTKVWSALPDEAAERRAPVRAEVGAYASHAVAGPRDGQVLVASDYGEVAVLDAATGATLWRVRPPGTDRRVAVAPGDPRVAWVPTFSADTSWTARVGDEAPEPIPASPRGPWRGAAWDPASDALILHDGARVVRHRPRQPPVVLGADFGAITALAASDDGVFVGTDDGQVHVLRR